MVPSRKVDLSMWLRANYPINKSSKSKRKTICGAGINDADYIVNPTIAGVRAPCLAYATWRGIIQRVVDLNYKEKHPAYRDVTVCDDWLRFMSFRRWWLFNYVEGFDIDKDLLSCAGKIYSPSTCVYVPRWLNVLLKDDLTPPAIAKGVLFEVDRGKFKATLKHENKTLNLGRFNSAEEAAYEVRRVKRSIIYSRKALIESIRPGLFDAVMLKFKEGP